MALQVIETAPQGPGIPEWIAAALRITNGRDPLGFESITIDRIVPILVPGILALSRRARYLSLHLYLLEHFRERGGGSPTELSDFIRKVELDYALAVRLCKRPGCGPHAEAVTGTIRSNALLVGSPNEYPRDFSVESNFGGYGLYYRTPLIELGLVAPQGTPWGDEKKLRYDRLGSDSARELASAFRSQIEGTRYFRDFMDNDQKVPAEVLEELSTRTCLCRLDEAPGERDLLISILFGDRARSAAAADVRRRAFGLLLSLIRLHPEVAKNESEWSRRILASGLAQVGQTSSFAETAAGWAALMAKETIQTAFSAAWTAFLHWAVANLPANGIAPDELRARVMAELAAPSEVFNLNLSLDEPAKNFAERLDDKLKDKDLVDIGVELLDAPTCIGAIGLLLLLHRRMPDPVEMPASWRSIGSQNGDWQPGLLKFTRELDGLLERSPSVAQLLDVLIWKHVVLAHHVIASAKLPYFTFRLRLEGGVVRFFRRLSMDPFNLGDSRHQAMALLGQDLGLWERRDGDAVITALGEDLINQAFA